jgi:signal transduction histidine kinase
LPQITGDSERLQQVLEELLANAIKFTAHGKVTLAVIEHPHQVEFVVADSGIGMTPEQIAAGFQPFQQGDGTATRNFGGLGLGLALSAQLVTLMGGELTVHSQEGAGATLRVTLPQD